MVRSVLLYKTYIERVLLAIVLGPDILNLS